MKKLSDLAAEEKGTIVKIRGESKIHRALLKMGLTVGSFIHLSDGDSPGDGCRRASPGNLAGSGENFGVLT